MSSGIGVAAAAFIVLLLLLDDHKFLDTILCLMFFLPYPFCFSRVAELVPLNGSPPFQTKVLVILVLVLLHLISRFHFTQYKS
jgi:hypothetical protein